MATGLDRIIEQILADAEAKAAEQVAAAEKEAKKTLADAAAEAEQKANILLADSEKDCTTFTNPTGTPMINRGLTVPSRTNSSKRSNAVGALPMAKISGTERVARSAG